MPQGKVHLSAKLDINFQPDLIQYLTRKWTIISDLIKQVFSTETFQFDTSILHMLYML